jgi:hypothetical protein
VTPELTPRTLTVEVAALESVEPSLTTKVTLRSPIEGFAARLSQRCSQALILNSVAAVGEPARRIFWGDGG